MAVVLLGSFRPDRIGPNLGRLGLHQSWDVFAPNPAQREVVFDAVITYADGSESTWRIPRAPALFPYPSHRWEMWEDRITSDSMPLKVWERAARYIAANHARGDTDPVRISLRRRWADLPPPQFHDVERVWNEFEFFTLALR